MVLTGFEGPELSSAGVGQPITVTEKRGKRSDVLRFELNRSLTGMGHERYAKGQEILGNRPPDELARRLLAKDGVDGVHIYSNVVTVHLTPVASTSGLGDIIHDLFVHYDHDEQPEGVTTAAE